MATPATPTTPLPTVTIQQVSNGFIITQQNNGPPYQPAIQQVFNDFPDIVSAMATIFGVTLPVASVTSAISSASSASTAAPATSAPASS